MTVIFNQGSKPDELSAKCFGPEMPVFLHTAKDTIELDFRKCCNLIYCYLFDPEIEGLRGYFLDGYFFSFEKGGCLVLKENKFFAHFSPGDFQSFAEYLITNSNLIEDDPRRKIVNGIIISDDKVREEARPLYQWILELQVVEGFPQIPVVEGSKRFAGKDGLSFFGW